MKSKGYTVVDILVIIVVLGALALLTLPNMSLAFKDNKEELYQNQIRLYLEQAKLYGENNKDKFDDDNTMVVTIDELIEEGYIGAYVSDKIYDVRDNVTELNKMKIRITYNEDDDTVDAKVV